jgi:aminopeptidase N
VPLSRAVNGNRMPTYRPDAEADVTATPTFRYWPRSANAITYDKTSLWMHTLERHLGWPTMQRVMAAYYDRWKFRHPRPQDFFDVVNQASGQDLTWFFDQVVRGSNTFDYAVQEMRNEAAGQGRTRIIVAAQRLGEATFPVDVVTTFADGQQVIEHWDGQQRRVVYTYERTARATRVEIDPGHVLLLDVNRTNNSRTAQPRSAAAARKWSLAWMVWLQELMITAGFFG